MPQVFSAFMSLAMGSLSSLFIKSCLSSQYPLGLYSYGLPCFDFSWYFIFISLKIDSVFWTIQSPRKKLSFLAPPNFLCVPPVSTPGLCALGYSCSKEHGPCPDHGGPTAEDLFIYQTHHSTISTLLRLSMVVGPLWGAVLLGSQVGVGHKLLLFWLLTQAPLTFSPTAGPTTPRRSWDQVPWDILAFLLSSHSVSDSSLSAQEVSSLIFQPGGWRTARES